RVAGTGRGQSALERHGRDGSGARLSAAPHRPNGNRRGRNDRGAGERHGTRNPEGDSAAAFRVLRHDPQGWRRTGSLDLPLDHRGARWQDSGGEQPGRRRHDPIFPSRSAGDSRRKPGRDGGFVSGEAPVIRIVDDDEAFRTAISRVVRAAGFEVREFASAGDYLLAQSEDEHGCLLLDLRMPGPSGLDLQRALSRKENSIPIVFLTAHGDISASVRAMKAGAADFLVKPVKRETLLSAIRTALAKDEEQRGARNELIELRSRYNSLSSRERDV